ncbi:MAG: L,D-transpeptidase [Candidatus Levybacteria bacterium]|nr:L,D-transpeptidase [Candidatus Levybacteria bacterium]
MSKKVIKSVKRGKNYALKLSVLAFGVLVVALGLTVYLNVAAKEFCANSISCITDLSGQRTDETKGVYLGKKVAVPEEKPTQYALEDTQYVLGEATSNTNKRLYVDLTQQKILAFEGDKLIYDFPVSTGKWYLTPTGEFRIWTWLRYTRMSGGNKANGTYYNLPNVPYTMFFANAKVPKYRGYGIHGAYWHNNFGTPMSHGCVNMREEDVAKIYEWTFKDQSIPLVIYGTTPKPV